MSKSGIKHIDVGAELTKQEWESENSHELVHGNAFPSSPVERQLFYRMDEHVWYIYNGSQWVSLQASGGGIQDHGNEYHTPDFATEAALASHQAASTGVHGVGASTVESAAGAQGKVDAHAALTNPHSSTPDATANRLILRDASARAKVAAPSAAEDIARKDTVDSHASATTGVHGVGASTVESASGAQAKVDTHGALTTAHSAVSTATPDRIVLRDAAGRAQVAAPAAADDIARKADVDAKPSTFLQLTDTPSSYAGHANKLVAVNPAADALEFVVGGAGGGDLFGLTRFLRASRYHVMPSGSTATLALTANTLYAVPFFTPVARTITRLAIHVTTAAAGTLVRLGVYNDGGAIYPTTLILDAGTVDSGTTGLKEITGLNIPFSANTLYWLALVSGGAPTLAATTAGLHWSLLGFGTALNTVGSGHWTVAFTMGALPANYPTGATAATLATPKLAVYF